MSSGEKAKPPFEERNPFDISRRSGPEVAAEIAKRMSAWKQARARTVAPSTTIPGGDAKATGGQSKLPGGTSLSGSAAKSPPIAAPVQPARMPPPAPATARDAGSAAPRVPYFASASTRRAMPPAPSLKQGSVRPKAPVDDDPVDGSTMPVVAPTLERESPRHDEAPPRAAATLVAAPSVEENPVRAEAVPSESFHPVEAPVAENPEPDVAEADDTERQRAEARAIKARWMAAHDLDALLETAATHQPTSAAHEQAAGHPDSPLPDEIPDEVLLNESAEPEQDTAPALAAEVAERVEPPLDAAVARAMPEPAAGHDVATEIAIDLAALDEIAGRREPTFDAPATATPGMTEEVPVIAARHEPAARAAADAADPRAEVDDELSIAALDEVAGRKEPTFDPPVPRTAIEIELPHRLANPAVEPGDNRVEAPELGIVAPDEIAGRKEPTFDQPVRRNASQSEPPQSEPPALLASPAPELEAPVEPSKPHSDAVVSDAAREDDRTAAEAPELSIAALDETAGRKEPTFDEPVRPAKPAAPRIRLRPIETRIEARRVETLRADPPLSARRPIFPHIEPDEWDVPPAIAARANRARRGTGWAIGLGSVLLIAGITAPAAIWQQGRQAEEQVALVTPLQPAPAAPSTTQVPAHQVPAQATLPEAPQPEAAPAVAAPGPGTPATSDAATQDSPAPTTVSDSGKAADPEPATTLSAISEGGEVAAAPVMAPPPVVNLASKTDPAGVAAPMVARPFVPQGGDGPFLRAPTTGTASVPVAGASAQSAAVGVKPSLMVQLKPAKTVAAAKPVASKPRPATRKPKPFFQQSPDQMFQTLIDTLGEGKPVNPATKPASPSNRR